MMYPITLQQLSCTSYAGSTPCDKVGRGGVDGPHSECRWFGGKEYEYTLTMDSNYNNQHGGP